jgi:glycosyltransferase involved in cell wall biosynthesis/predicted SAM-dependent methyltransferase
MARVSVIIPTYNRFRLLCRAVESVLKQSYQDHEVIVVDDGSDDETADEFPRWFPSAEYLRISHSGSPAIARNAGIRIAKGEYLAFLDSDDQWLPEKLALQVEALDTNPKAGLVCSNAFVIHQDSESPSCPHLAADQGKSGHVLQALVKDNFVIASTAIVRRSVLNQVGTFAEETALQAVEDYDLWLRIATASEIAYLPQALAIYRDIPSSSIRGSMSEARHWESRLLVLQRLRHLLASHMTNHGATEAVVRDQSSEFREYCAKAYWSERQYLHAIPHLLAMYCRHPARVTRAAYRRIQKSADCHLSESAARPPSLPTGTGGDEHLKLHLGCGEVYLPGYVNVDFPSAQHSVQRQSKADLVTDLSQLHYPPGAVDEIRLHHVFEHFERPVALRLLMEWYAWLKDGGRLIIETPDFHRCVQEYLNNPNLSDQMKIVRHLFGSQEASWAVHYDGWYREKFEHVLTALGYQELEFSFGEWQGTYNIIVTAKKTLPFRSQSEQMREVKSLLGLSLVNDSPTEKRMLQVWMKQLDSTNALRDTSLRSARNS